jgi:hypothetical protein
MKEWNSDSICDLAMLEDLLTMKILKRPRSFNSSLEEDTIQLL